MNPPALQPGSRIALVSPSGAVDSALVEQAARLLSDWGWQPVVAPHALGKFHRFAASDDDRLADLQAALDDDSIDAVWCTRGGYGLCRIVDRLRWEGFARHPKWVVGFSDITCLHGALTAQGYGSLHGVMCKQLAQLPGSRAVTELHRILTGGGIDYREEPHPCNRPGQVTGLLVGGNLSVLNGLTGTPFAPIPDGAVLLMEDLCEAPYHIDRMIRKLRLSGLLGRLGGIVAGQFTDLDEDDSFPDAYGILQEALGDLSLPVACNFPVGHVDDNLPLVLGAPAALSVTAEGAQLKQTVYL